MICFVLVLCLVSGFDVKHSGEGSIVSYCLSVNALFYTVASLRLWHDSLAI